MTGPTIDAVEARAYRIPTPAPEADGTLTWDSTTLVTVHVRAGTTRGLGWTYEDAACVPLIHNTLAPIILGQNLLEVPACWSDMQRQIRNLGRPGLVSCALSAVDIALWDAAARTLGLPVSSLLGRIHDDVALYGSGGFTNQSLPELQSQLDDWVQQRQIPRVKIKIGQDRGQAVDRDLRRVAATRAVVGDEVEIYVDANGGYAPGQARRVARRLEQQDVRWFEEPVSSDDLGNLAQLREVTTADITAGEYGYDLAYFARMIAAGAVDCLQIDVTRCGGYTEWQRAAAVAAGSGVEVSAHCAPNLSAHVAVATLNVRHLEWFADHDRIESTFFDGALNPAGGRVQPDRTVPGHGLTLKHADIDRYAVDEEVLR